MIDLCNILEKLHSLNPPLIHRDIKPSNIMITSYDRVVLLDFNAAKYCSSDADRTSDTVLLGTQGYAAPEQYGFKESSPQTDIYSLGIVLREATAALAINTHNYDAIINKCTQMDPRKRYRSVKELKMALMRLLGTDTENRSASFLFSYLLPPGFRTMTAWKMVIAIPTYVLIFWLCLTLEVKDTFGTALWIERIFLLIIFLVDIFVGFNYLGVRDRFPLCKSNNRVVRTLGVVTLISILTVSLFLLLMMLEVILFPPPS